MKISEIINQLCSHEISKQEAIVQLTEITDGLRKKNTFEFTVEEVGHIQDGHLTHGYLNLKLPYRFYDIQDRVRVGDKVDVTFLP